MKKQIMLQVLQSQPKAMTQLEKKQEKLIETTAGLLVACKLSFNDVVKELKKLTAEIDALKQQGEKAVCDWMPDKGTSGTRCAKCGKDRWQHEL